MGKRIERAIDIDGRERSIEELCDRYGLTRGAIMYRLVLAADGKRHLRPHRKTGRPPKRKGESPTA